MLILKKKLRLFYRIAVFIISVSFYKLDEPRDFLPLFRIIYLIALLELLLVLIPSTNNKVSSGKHLLKFYAKKSLYDVASYKKFKGQSDNAALAIFII